MIVGNLLTSSDNQSPPLALPHDVPETAERDGGLTGKEHSHGTAVIGVDQEDKAHPGEVHELVAIGRGECSREDQGGEPGRQKKGERGRGNQDPGVGSEGAEEELWVDLGRLRCQHQADSVEQDDDKVQEGFALGDVQPRVEADGLATLDNLGSTCMVNKLISNFCR